jgi:hypothetical protein
MTTGSTPLRVGVLVPTGQHYAFLNDIQTDSGSHLTLYPTGVEGVSPGIRLPGRDTKHLPATSSEIKDTWI